MKPTFEIHCGDALEVMKTFSDGRFDFLLADLPYGETAQSWDSTLDMQLMWQQVKRVAANDAVICLFAGESFSAPLQMSNIEDFRFKWFWWKNRSSNFLNAPKRPLKVLEEILIFSSRPPIYYPQKSQGHEPVNFARRKANSSQVYGFHKEAINNAGATDRYPTNVLIFNSLDNISLDRLHPNQKPIDLLSYLIRTHSAEGDTVLDFTAGSFSTGVACMIEKRNFVGIELSQEYCDIGEARMRRALLEPVDIPRRFVERKDDPNQKGLF